MNWEKIKEVFDELDKAKENKEGNASKRGSIELKWALLLYSHSVEILIETDLREAKEEIKVVEKEELEISCRIVELERKLRALSDPEQDPDGSNNEVISRIYLNRYDCPL